MAKLEHFMHADMSLKDATAIVNELERRFSDAVLSGREITELSRAFIDDEPVWIARELTLVLCSGRSFSAHARTNMLALARRLLDHALVRAV